MKLTWFGGTTLRVYIGGEIVVIDADLAPSGVDRGELLAGADRVMSLAQNDVAPMDSDNWRPRVVRPLEDLPKLEMLSFGPSTLVISAAAEPPLVIADVVDLPHFGRWVDGSVFVVFGRRGLRMAWEIDNLGLASPKLLALAADAELAGEVEELFDRLVVASDMSPGFNISLLEPGLALEL